MYSDEFLEKADKIRVNTSSCQVYLGIRHGEKIDDVGDLLFTSKAPEFDSEELLDMKTKSKTFSIYYPKTRPGSDHYTVVASMNSRYEDWATLDEETYQLEKQSLICPVHSRS